MKLSTIAAALTLIALTLAVAEAQAPCPPEQVCPLPTDGWRAGSAAPARPRQLQRPQQPRQTGNPAIVRVICRYRVVKEGRQVQVTGAGSGTIFDRRDGVAYVVTCEHGPKQGMFVLAGGREYPATIVRQDALWDVIVLRIKDPGIKPLPVADTAPTRGDTVWVAGWGLGTYRHTRGQLVGFSAPSRSTPFELAEISAVCRQGDSGGPMLGPRGRIVGVISGTDKRTTVGCGFPRLRRILRAVLPPYPNRPGIVLPKPRQVVPMEPKQPPTGTPVAPACAALLARVAELESQVKALQEQVAACAAEKGPPGEAASMSPIDLDALAAKVLAKLPPQRVEWETLDGTVLFQEKPLGEALRFKSVEIDARK